MDPYEPTNVDIPDADGPRMRLTEIRRIEVFSVAKLCAVLYGGIGLFIGGIYGFFMVVGGVIGAASGEPEALVMAGVGVMMFLFVPVFYGAIGAVAAAMSALIYNLGADWLGGIRIELRDV